MPGCGDTPLPHPKPWPRWLRLVTWRVHPPDWPAGQPLRLLLFADPHTGWPQMPMRRLQQAVEAAQSLKPDVITLMGDYIADHMLTRPVPVQDVARSLAQLSAPLGAWAITGNHDWYQDPDAQHRGQGPVAIAKALQDAGIPVLENQARGVNLPSGAGFWLVGLGSQQIERHRGAIPSSGTRGVDDLEGALGQIADDAPAILLAHEPNIITRVPPRIALTLSGHTHGGQINLPFLRDIAARHLGTPYLWGHHDVAARALVVSGGMGCSGIPLRIRAKPELTMVEISAPI